MKHCTPEQAGISSAHVAAFVKKLEDFHLSTHSILMARGDDIFFECYYAPFHKDFKHRMYSVSKSFVSVAIGFCEQEGLLSLDDPMLKYFPEYAVEGAPNATLREMLMMETAEETMVKNWFQTVEDDRVACYFKPYVKKYPHTLFSYDSSGSYMLGVIVERVTGKPFLAYLQEKVLNGIGFSKDAYCLQAPGGYSWGDSGVMCTARDLMLFARFVLNKGSWQGKQYLNRAYLEAATSMQVSNGDYGFAAHDANGYGYQFWGAPEGCFSMLGMGNQVALCDPTRDFIFVINSDNQGNDHGYEQIFFALYEEIIPHLGKPLLPDAKAAECLAALSADRKLFYLPGAEHSNFTELIDGKVYWCEENPMGIEWLQLTFERDEGVLHYKNAQGEKAICFGFGKNVFGKFPEQGYADLVGTVFEKGHYYDCAASADWVEPQKLRIRVQIIDKYFGNLAIVIGFRDAERLSVRMRKKAEDFLDKYSGILNATLQ